MEGNIYDLMMKELIENRNSDNAKKMSAYMKNKFEFLGIQAKLRKEISKKYLKALKINNTVDWDFIDSCWKSDYRELQYIAGEHLRWGSKYLNSSDMKKLRELIETKSWWDTIDILDRVVGEVVLNSPETKDLILKWSLDENFWIRRIAIDHQLSRKEKTDEELLEKIILNNFGHDEFFINKSIGWALREYSKTNPSWVRSFIEKHGDKMSNLSKREASKYI